MGNRDPTPVMIKRMDRLVVAIEDVLFKLALMPRWGLTWRGVDDPTHQLGHQGVVTQTCRWFNLEFRLRYEELLIFQMGLDHDVGDLVMDQTNPFPEELPSRILPSFVDHLVSAGSSYDERVSEYRKISQKLPHLFEGLPRVWEATDHSLVNYFRRPKRRFGSAHNEAWFVHNIGKVSDAHFALWHCREGDMEINSWNIRTFTERLTKRVRDEIAKLYWHRVKVRYQRELQKVYRDTEKVKAL